MDKIQKISCEEAAKVITTREPRGLFYCISSVELASRYVGIDNRDGDSWTEDFKSLSACKRWLERG